MAADTATSATELKALCELPHPKLGFDPMGCGGADGSGHPISGMSAAELPATPDA